MPTPAYRRTMLAGSVAEAAVKGKDVKIKGHTPGAWLNYLLFKLLPPKLYLRSQGIEYCSEPPAVATITYELHGEEKQVQVKFSGGARTIVKMFPWWVVYGFLEPESVEKGRHYIPSHNIQRIEWYDPVLEDYFRFIRRSRLVAG